VDILRQHIGSQRKMLIFAVEKQQIAKRLWGTRILLKQKLKFLKACRGVILRVHQS
jgi:hypothetical protein